MKPEMNMKPEMTEELQNAAHDGKHLKQRYYKVVYQTIREEMEVPPVQFRALLLRLLGDEDKCQEYKILFRFLREVGNRFSVSNYCY